MIYNFFFISLFSTRYMSGFWFSYFNLSKFEIYICIFPCVFCSLNLCKTLGVYPKHMWLLFRHQEQIKIVFQVQTQCLGQGLDACQGKSTTHLTFSDIPSQAAGPCQRQEIEQKSPWTGGFPEMYRLAESGQIFTGLIKFSVRSLINSSNQCQLPPWKHEVRRGLW